MYRPVWPEGWMTSRAASLKALPPAPDDLPGGTKQGLRTEYSWKHKLMGQQLMPFLVNGWF